MSADESDDSFLRVKTIRTGERKDPIKSGSGKNALRKTPSVRNRRILADR